jgi:hypothetical protein
MRRVLLQVSAMIGHGARGVEGAAGIGMGAVTQAGVRRECPQPHLLEDVEGERLSRATETKEEVRGRDVARAR